jgi:hypothetical protein
MSGRKIALNLRGLIFLPHIFLLKPGPVRDTPPRIFETIRAKQPRNLRRPGELDATGKQLDTAFGAYSAARRRALHSTLVEAGLLIAPGTKWRLFPPMPKRQRNEDSIC